MKQVFLVKMFSGEGADYDESVLSVFMTEALAKKFLKKKNKEYNKLGLNRDGDNSKSGISNYDYCREHGCDYTGASFRVDGPYDLQEE